MSTHNQIMEALSARVTASIQMLRGKRVVLVGYPIHNNVGDVLIHLGTLRAMASLGAHVVQSFSMDDIGAWDRKIGTFVLKGRIDKLDGQLISADYLVFQGGGNLGDLWPLDQLMREALLLRHPNIPAIFLPQSAHFNSTSELARARRVMSTNRGLILLCRDRKTQLLFEDSVTTVLCPDMAHCLWREEPIETARASVAQPGSHLHQQRRDKESAEASPLQSSSFDWMDLMPTHEKLATRALGLLKRFSIPGTLHAEERAWAAVEQLWLRRYCTHFSQYQSIATDRLHGLILSCLLARQTCYLDSDTGKLSQYAGLWLSQSDKVNGPEGP